MLQITNNINRIKNKLEEPAKPLIDKANFEKLLSKIPESINTNNNTEIEDNDARDFLENQLNEINEAMTEEMTKVCQKILAEIEFDLPTFLNDTEFFYSFEHWIKNPTDLKHVRMVAADLKVMSAQYETHNVIFNNEMKKINEIKFGFSALIKLANASFNKLLQTKHPNETNQFIEELRPILDRIYKQQTHLLDSHDNVLEILKKYNDQRMEWAEFLIGMKETIISHRNEVKATKKNILHKLCGGTSRKEN